VERNLPQIAFALAPVSLAGELIVAPLLRAWHRHVARLSQRGAVT
jgi:hypothetical protein